jgi:hypothetical protein
MRRNFTEELLQSNSNALTTIVHAMLMLIKTEDVASSLMMTYLDDEV